MREDILVSTLHAVRRHPWWRARAALALAILKKHRVALRASALDAGCGWGVTLAALERAGYRAAGLDVSRRILELIDQPGRTLIQADLGEEPPDGIEPYDVVLALDVLEHMDDDRASVARLARLMRPGSLAIISVPALPDLYCEFDSVQGHRRRYTPATLRRAVEGGGLVVVDLFWWGAWMVPVLRATRWRRRVVRDEAGDVYAEYLRLPPWPVPALMRLAFACEHGVALRGRLPIGSSLFTIARLPGSREPLRSAGERSPLPLPE